MKRFYVLLLLPIFLLAQNNGYKDRVVYKNHQSYNITVRIIVDEMLYYRFGRNMQKAIGMGAVDSLFIDPLGLVYTAEKGYLTDRAAIDAVLQSHTKSADDIPLTPKSRGFLSRIGLTVSFVPYSHTLTFQNNYTTRQSPLPFANSIGLSESKIDFELAFALNDQVEIISSFSVNTDNSFSKNYSRYETNDPQQNEQTGNSGEVNIGAGLKYFLSQVNEFRSRFFVLALGGLVLSNSKDLYKQIQPPDDSSYHDNADTYFQDLFSPFFVTVGFGGEYAFNDALALVGDVKFRYRSSSADFKSEQTNPERLNTTHTDVSSVDTRVGIGIKFRF